MPSPPVVDFDRLLASISEEAPGGVELREDDDGALLFGELRDAFNKARSDEREKLKWETIKAGAGSAEGSSADPSLRRDLEEPDWQAVRELAIDVLAQHSKDLWVATWLTDALVRTDGIAGLRDGLKLLHELADRFWENIHPAPEDGSYEGTTAQLRSLVGAPLAAAIRNVPLALGAECSFTNYRHAATSDPDALGPILAAVESTPATYYAEMVEDLQEAMQHLKEMGQLFLERCGPDEAPNPAAVRSELEECLNNVRTVAADKLAAVASSEVEGEGEDSSDGGAAGAAESPRGAKGFDVGGRIASREEAFQVLHRVAEFFKSTEPTSPVPIVLEHAVRLGRKPFTELIQELISDEAVREDVYRRIGAKLIGEEEEEV